MQLPGSTWDCLIDSCTVRIERAGAVVATAPVVFPTPNPTATVVGIGTVDLVADDVVTQVTVACGDHSTPITVEGTVSQPGVSAGFTVSNQYCPGGGELQIYIPSRTFQSHLNPFAVGTATVTAAVRPHVSVTEGTATTFVGTTNLLDHTEVTAALLPLLADPANTEVRQMFLDTIRARSAQDPVFRAFWLAALQGA